MALISTYERDNSRTVYRILADQAVKCLEDPRSCTDEKIILANLSRLLERYRYDTFVDYVAPGVLEAVRTAVKDPETHGHRTASRHMEGVVTALESAHAKVYGNLPKEDVVRNLQALLAQLAASGEISGSEQEKYLKQARQFFRALSDGLKTP